MTRILVLYGTTDGHTAKVARAITHALSTHDVQAELVDAARADPDPSGYTGVIVAASVHAGGFQKAVQRWVTRHAAALRGLRTAFVGVCLGILQHDPKVDRELETIIARFLAPTTWQPGERKLVAGALLYTRYNWVKRWVMRRIVSRAGGDLDTSRDYEYTDWDDLRAFAVQFADGVAGRHEA
jgi:menaquinone-dependent protoporphyrinogen oxidase